MKIGYGRTSKNDQDSALQEDALRAAGCEAVYVEVVSRDGPRRAKKGTPELDQALKALRPGDTLVVWKMDRLSGSLSELIRILEWLRKTGVEFESLTERIDTSTPHGELFFNITGAFAQFERKLIAERTRAGLDAAKRRGKTGGRRPLLNEAQVKKLAILARDPAMTRGELCTELGVSRSTLYNYLRAMKSQSEEQ